MSHVSPWTYWNAPLNHWSITLSSGHNFLITQVHFCFLCLPSGFIFAVSKSQASMGVSEWMFWLNLRHELGATFSHIDCSWFVSPLIPSLWFILLSFSFLLLSPRWSAGISWVPAFGVQRGEPHVLAGLWGLQGFSFKDQGQQHLQPVYQPWRPTGG